MKILALETSTKNFSLAVTNGGRVTHSRNVVLDKVLSSSIIPGIRRILDHSGIAPSKLDGLAVGLGPGSFTSLRVGLATVKGLSMALRIPVVGIPSPDVLAMNALTAVCSGPAERVCTLGDARRNLVFSCLFEMRKGRPVRKSAYRLTPLDEALLGLTGKVLFIGDGVPLYSEKIIHHGDNRSSSEIGTALVPLFAPPKLWFPQARHLAVLAAERFRQGKVTKPALIKPLYLYPADCQVHKSS